jgi:hypothetical protein
MATEASKTQEENHEMRIKVVEQIETRRKRFFYGVLFASFFWLLFLAVVSLQAIREYVNVESRAYEEVYKLRKHNNLLQSENQNLDRLNRKLRKG